jgi:hypothetical protein
MPERGNHAGPMKDQASWPANANGSRSISVMDIARLLPSISQRAGWRRELCNPSGRAELFVPATRPYFLAHPA